MNIFLCYDYTYRPIYSNKFLFDLLFFKKKIEKLISCCLIFFFFVFLWLRMNLKLDWSMGNSSSRSLFYSFLHPSLYVRERDNFEAYTTTMHIVENKLKNLIFIDYDLIPLKIKHNKIYFLYI